MGRFRLFLSNFQQAPSADIQRKGLGRWFEILEVHPMKLFWANLLTLAFLLPCIAAAFFMLELWDWLSIGAVWLFYTLAGPAVTALHFICIQAARGKPIWLKEDYFSCFKREWKRAMALSALIGALWLILLLELRMAITAGNGLGLLPLIGCGFLLSGFSVFSYQQLAMIELPFGNVIKNGVLLIFAGKGRSFAAVLYASVCIGLCVYFYGMALFALLLGFYAFSIMTVNFIFLPVFNELFPSE